MTGGLDDPGAPLPISVVVPAYNREHLLRESLDAVLAQSRLPAELIVVDDGSSDASEEVARAWGRDAEAATGDRMRVEVLRQPNGGAASARNAGVRAATQPWIAFLDSDDLWVPEKLELQWRVLEADPTVTGVFADLTQFDHEGNLVTPSFLARYQNYRRVERRSLGPDAYRLDRESLGRLYVLANFLHLSTLVVRKDLLRRVGPMVEDLEVAEDREFFLRLLKFVEMAVVERPLVSYRIHPENISGNQLTMIRCTVELADRIERSPDRYVRGAEEFFVARRPALLKAAGLHSMAEGRFREARLYFGRKLREERSLTGLAGCLLSWTGAPGYALARRIKRGLAREGAGEEDASPAVLGAVPETES